MKCFWCLRIHEEGHIPWVKIRGADYVYEGHSICSEHLDIIRNKGVMAMLSEGLR